jgi:hypothetical protein
MCLFYRQALREEEFLKGKYGRITLSIAEGRGDITNSILEISSLGYNQSSLRNYGKIDP